MSVLVPIALFGWIPVVLLLFAALRPRRAVVTAFVAGWLFLPMAGYGVPGLPDYTKMTATCVGVLLGVAFFDASRLAAFRPKLVDLPMLVWCACPFFTSMVNGLGAYDGFSAVMYQTERWGLPYFIGRLYFGDLEGLRELAVGVFIGGLVYVPLCLWEIRMSPQLHETVYGFHQHSFGQTRRFGGWRPMVFLQHGLMVGMWMTSASVLGFWLWRSGALRRLRGAPVWALVAVQIVTTVLCKSFGALVLLAGGIGLLLGRRIRPAVLAALLLPPVYMAARVQGWYPQIALDAAGLISEGKAGSLRMRIDAEAILVEHAMSQPLLGWGAYDRNRVYNEEGRLITVTDSLWIITLGQKGLLGLTALAAALLVGPAVLLLGVRPRHWAHPELAPATGLAVIVLLFAYDSLINGMINPVYTLAAGGVTGLVGSRRALQARCRALELARSAPPVREVRALGAS